MNKYSLNLKLKTKKNIISWNNKTMPRKSQNRFNNYQYLIKYKENNNSKNIKFSLINMNKKYYKHKLFFRMNL